MVKIDVLIIEGKVSKIGELELSRYNNFFENSYKDNLEHSKSVKENFPRWSIISGYYAMHDITKLLLAKKIQVKNRFGSSLYNNKSIERSYPQQKAFRSYRKGV